MRRLLCWFLLMALGLHLAGRWVVVAIFEANRAAIARELCEQRAVKDNCCQGSCHLRKQLKQVDQTQQKRAHTLEAEFSPFVANVPVLLFGGMPLLLGTPSKKERLSKEADTLADGVAYGVWHPPC